MNLFQVIIISALLGNTVLGLIVFFSNPKRAANVGFVFLSLLVMFWFVAMYYTTLPSFETMLTFWISQTSAWGVMLPVGVFSVQFTILHPNVTFKDFFIKLRWWFFACIVFFMFCHTPFFIRSAALPPPGRILAVPSYGWGFVVFIIFFVVVICSVVFGFCKNSKCNAGVQRAELHFLQIGCASALVIAVLLLVAAQLFGNQEIALFLPLSVLVLDGFIAYGIATRRILAVSEVLQRVVSYLLMGLYLSVLYICVAWVGHQVFHWFVADTVYLSGLLAALAVAFSVVPAQSWMQRFSYRLFSSSHQFNVDRVLQEAERVFQEVSTDETLMASFSSYIIRMFQTTRVVLLKEESNGIFCQHYSFPEWTEDERLFLNREGGLLKLINRDLEPFTTDTLERMRSSVPVLGARREMKKMGTAVAVGSFAHKKLSMVVLLYPKTNGAIYDLREQRALQLVCNQMAVALENAKFYTEIQNGKIYNEILLDSLASGIVAVNESRKVTVFNQKAQAITRLPVDDILNEKMDKLPAPLVRIIDKILTEGEGIRDYDTFIGTSDDRTPIRVSGSAFHGYTGKSMGALLVFSDMTLLRKMEERIRRTDRLSSIGTLSAGMAHEIRNPLVTIKTFTELLPAQYGNREFRETFFDLVDQEVQRIDAIVNRLLNFARPAKASLMPVYLHDIIENSVRLVEQQLLKSRIHLEKELKASRHLVLADAEQINQTLVNFFLNAIQAMEPGGTLRVETVQGESVVCINVRDTGCGLTEDQKKHIFDPFFTTKESGVGLGLSVSHGIIQEHQGSIHVESEPGKGTEFHVELPLIDEKEI